MGEKNKQIPPWLNFVIGGMSGMMAISVVQPADLVKTRMQLSGPSGKKSVVAVVGDILRKEGVTGFYSGLSAALFRQATYTTGRLGCFNVVMDVYKGSYGTPNFATKLVIGMLSGGVGAFIGTPAEVALIRMTADGRLPPDQRRNYKNVFDALGRHITGCNPFYVPLLGTGLSPLLGRPGAYSITLLQCRIAREEGVTKLWRGASATITRAMVVNGAQLGTYAQAREAFLPALGDGIFLHFVASMISGLVTTFASLPVDIVKTRVQNTAKGASQLQVLTSIIRNEGVLALWSGFIPTYAKLGPHTVLTFIFMEQLNALYYRMT